MPLLRCPGVSVEVNLEMGSKESQGPDQDCPLSVPEATWVAEVCRSGGLRHESPPEERVCSSVALPRDALIELIGR